MMPQTRRFFSTFVNYFGSPYHLSSSELSDILNYLLVLNNLIFVVILTLNLCREWNLTHDIIIFSNGTLLRLDERLCIFAAKLQYKFFRLSEIIN